MLDIGQVDLARLGEVLGQPEEAIGALDPASGELRVGGDPAPEDWIAVGGEDVDGAYDDMEVFAGEIGDPLLATRLTEALAAGPGAARAFRGILATAPGDLPRQWADYRRLRDEVRALRWLAGHGLLDVDEVERGVADRLRRADEVLASL